MDRGVVLPLAPASARKTGRRLWFAALGVAQAAAIVLAILYFAPPKAGPQPPQVVQNAPVVDEPPVAVEIDPGESVIILADGHKVELALNENGFGIDPGLETLNLLEATATQ
jgi:hypothetical protein